MADTSPHPSPQVLAAFGLGKLPDAASTAVARHLLTCLVCRRAIEGQAPEASPGKVREAGAAPAAAPPVAVPAALAGHPKYRIVRELGRGGMGVVYQAVQTLMDRPIALKVINPAVLAHPSALPRFLAEVKAAARLDHPHIVRAYDADQVGDLHLLVMEFIEGRSLYDLVQRQGPLPVAHACHYVRQAALGLQHASERGMVHRDIKPHNLMVNSRGQVKVLDFGLARLRGPGEQVSGMTEVGAFMGTPEYMAPEQAADARTADVRADLYSLGCTLYFLLTGKPPFVEETVIKLVLAHLDKKPPPLHELRPDLPPDLSAVVTRLLAKDPADRYQQPLELARALSPFVKATPSKGAAETLLPAVTSPVAPTSPDTAGTRGPWVKAPLAPTALAPDEPTAPGGRANGPGPRRRRVLAGVAGAVVVLGLGAWLLGGVVFKAPVKTADAETTVPVAVAAVTPDVGRPAPAAYASPAELRLRPAFKNRCGDWKVDGDELEQTSLVTDCRLAFGDFRWTDYDFTCEAKKVGGFADVALNYRVTGAGCGDFTLGRFTNQSASAWSVERGRQSDLARAPGALETGRWYRLGVSVRGTHCRCSFDGQLLFEYDDAHNPRGAVGLRTWATAARFRNIRVTDPAGQVLFEGLPRLPAVGDQWFPPTEPPVIGELHCLKGHGAPVTCVTFTRDGRHVISGSDGGTGRAAANGNTYYYLEPPSTVRLWDAATGAEFARSPVVPPVMKNHRPFIGVIPAPATPRFFTVNILDSFANGKQVQLWTVAAGTLQPQHLFQGQSPGVIDVVVTPDESRVVLLESTGGVWEWDLKERAFRRQLPGTLKNVACSTIAPDGRRALLARHGEPFAEIDLATGEETGRWKQSVRGVTCLAYSPDGRRIASTGTGGAVRLWDVESATELPRVGHHQGPARVVAFSPDGRLLLSGGEDHTVRLWDPDGKKELAHFTGHTGTVHAVAFSPDGKQAASGSTDYTVRLWRLPAPPPSVP